MFVSINFDGSITISKPIHENYQDICKQTYYGYSETEAKKRFREYFKEQKQKSFINKK